MEIGERRARVGGRHHLAAGAGAASVIEVARDLVALHSTDPASVFLAAAARLRDPEVEAIERALYEERTLVRLLGMRRTMFAVPTDVVPIVQAACAQALVPGERRKVVQLLEESGVAADGDAWLLRAEEATVQALSALGEATAAELSKEVPALRERMRFGEGTKWAGVQGVSTRVLFLLGAQGRIVRGRPRGSWTSSQYRWSTTQAWLPAGVTEMTPEAARTELVRRWLRSFGLDASRRARCPHRRSHRRCRDGRCERFGTRRRPRAGTPARAVGGPSAGPRPDGDGMDGTSVVPR
jgi:hypothetical protein